MTVGHPPPLARLFAIAYRSFIDGLHTRLAERGWSDVRPNYGFVLIAARDNGIQSSEIAVLMGISKQAASKLIESMEGAGYVRRDPHPADQRAKIIHLTALGAELLVAVEEIYEELEQTWADAIGRKQVETVRTGITKALMETNDGQLPAIRPPQT